MKQWVVKLLQQLDISFSDQDSTIDLKSAPQKKIPQLSEEKATLLYIIDIFNKHLFEVEKHSVRKVREKLDSMAKNLVESDTGSSEKHLADIRQFFSSYRIDEYTYIQNTFDDFKRIVWDLADQLSEDFQAENPKEDKLNHHLKDLKEAVEANSLEILRKKSREFINLYVERQHEKNEARKKRMSSVKKNLDLVKKQLLEANSSLFVDHLTGAANRKCFDDQIKKFVHLNKINPLQVSLIILDIDFFKKINDNYGHDVGDFVLKEAVRILKSIFHKDTELVSRIGGEEFAILLPNHSTEHCVFRAEEIQKRIQSEVFIHADQQIRFTVSMGIAQLNEIESASSWVKRADTALYQSKNTGRNKFSISSESSLVSKINKVA